MAKTREDAPWAWGYWAYVGLAFQSWVHNGKPSIVIRDETWYYRIDPAARVAKQAEWNKPTWWPIVLLALAALGMAWIGRRSYRARQQATAKAGLPASVVPSTAAGG